MMLRVRALHYVVVLLPRVGIANKSTPALGPREAGEQEQEEC